MTESKPAETTGSRLKMSKSLLRAAGRAAVETALTKRDVSLLGIPELAGKAEEAQSVLGDKALLLSRAELSGLWHYSANRIDRFDEAEAAKRGGKFGKGTYLGVGELSGETVDGLKNSDAVRHEATFSGNVLVVPRANVLSVADDLRTEQGMPVPRLKTKIQNAPLTDLLESLPVAGEQVDAIMIIMDEENKAAELAVLPRAVADIEIIN